MLPSFAIGDKILKRLLEIDEATSARVAKWGCLHCTGPLHRADYPRKPRGGLLAVFGEGYSTRISLCCGWEGCRRRATPPSVRFLGRRVYLGVVVMVASIFANTTRAPGEVKRTTGIPRRTVNRWRKWWRSGFVKSRLFEGCLTNAGVPFSKKVARTDKR